MLVQYYVLKALAEEFDSALRGSKIQEIYSQQKNELVISSGNFSSLKENEKEKSLCISVSPGFNYILLRRSAIRARKNSVSLFESLTDSTIEGITIHPCDRTLTVSVSGSMKVVIRLYNTAESNIFLTDKTDRIIRSFKHSRELSGTQFVFSERIFDEKIFQDETVFAEILRKHSGVDMSRALKELLPQFGPVYVKELIQRAGSGEQRGESLEQGAVSRELGVMIKELDDPVPIVYVGENGVAQLSVIRLKTMEHLESKQFSTVNEAVEQIIAGRFRERKGATERQTLLKKLGTEIGKIEKALTAIKNQNPADPKLLEYSGQMILSNLDLVKKGMKSVELPDLHKPNETFVIALDPSILPVQNADKYFQKARKTVKELEETEIRFKQLTTKLETLKEMEKSVLDSDASVGVKSTLEEHKDALRMLNLDQKGKEKESLPFRVFPLEHGYEVWVGKSSTSNDLLTMKHTAPHDLWFHVRGASGSHTVLKVKKGENVPRNAVYKAAGIAAYYSKMRNASNVPVAYCERKYVRKPKGVKSGTVTMEREKVIFVKPNLP
jgi:predicted ribosome quality control (RQC) complex YloA/Tae2 family protein